MAKIKSLFVLIGVFLMSVSFAYAASFEVKVIPIRDKIVVDELAEFNISIQNNLESDEDFLIKKAGYPFWDMYTKPLQNPLTLRVPGKSSASITLFVDPLYITTVDTYTLEAMVVLERTGEGQKAPITVGIKSTDPLIGGYIPTVLTTVSISPDKIDPRNDVVIKIGLNNQNILDYANLTIKVESNLFKEEIHYPLGPKEDKIIEIIKDIDDSFPPHEDRVIVAIFKDQRMIVNPIVKEFEIVEYATQEELPTEKSFLKIRKGIRVTSNNPLYKGIVKVETTPLKNLFLSSHPRAETVTEDEKHYLVWNVEVGDDKIATVYTTENYRPIVVIIILSIAAIILYFVFRSPMVVRKSIVNVGTSEGGISEAKIAIRVKNRSSKPLTNIEVLDNVPHIVHVEKDLSIGSMHPHAILSHPKKGLIIKWTIEALEPGDERVLSYKMRSRLAILGEFNLPAANARCKVGNKVVISNSNRVSIGG